MKTHVWALAFVLGGCGYAQQIQESVEDTAHLITTPTAQIRAERAAADDATCRGYGAMPNTPVYVQCRVGLDQARATRAAAVQSAPAAYGAPPPAFSPPVNCTTTYGGRTATQPGVAFTNCN